MDDRERCPTCGSALPADVLDGLCPACLLEQALEIDASSEPAPDAMPGESTDAPDDRPRSPHDLSTALVLPGPEPASGPVAWGPVRIRYFGDYEIIREVARGGMGVVFLANQISLNRKVALKMILGGQLADESEVRRFHTEAEAAAHLDHPGIVPIFEVGQHEGQHYFSMGFVDGESLAHRLAAGPLPCREAAVILASVAEAIDYAHRRGVIHRDLKPSNILIDAGGHPRVTDFGLAKKVEGNSDLTASGQIMGTPSYMPPEQAGGRRGVVGPAADIYALGATLYCAVTGRPPFQAASPIDTLLQVIDEEPVPPRRLNATVDRDIETIGLKCLKKEPARRYATSAELAEDLRRYLAGEPIRARPVGRLERLGLWCRRNRTLAIAIGSAALLLLAVAVVSVGFAFVLSRSLAESNRRMAAFHFERGRAACAREEVAPGLLSMVESWRSAVAARDPAWQHTARAALSAWQRQNPRVRFVFSHTRAVRNVGFSPDGRTAFTSSLDNTVRLWDVATGQSVGEPLEHRLAPNVVVFTADGARVLTGDEAGVAQFWDAATGRPSGPALIHAGPVRGLAISPDGKTVLTASGARIPLGNPADPRPAPAGSAAPSTVDFGEMRLWDAATSRALAGISSVHSAVVAFSRDGKEGIAASYFMTSGASSMDLATGKRTRPAWEPNASGGVTYLGSGPIFPGPMGSVDRNLAFSRDGGAVLFSVVGFNAVFRRLDAEGTGGSATDQRSRAGFRMEHPGPIRAVALSPDGRVALTGGADRTARLWSTETGRPLFDPLVHALAVNCVVFSRDGRTALTGSDDGTARLWAVATGKRLGVPLVHQAPVRAVAFSPDGRHILTGCEDGESRLWDPTIEGPGGIALASATPGRILAAALSPDGGLLITAAEDGDVRPWDARTGKPLRQPWAHEKAVHAVAVSPDGNTILAGTWMQARLYDAATAKVRGAPLIHQVGFVRAVAFSPDGQRALTGGDDGFAWLWDTATGQPIGKPMVLNKPVSAVAYGADGRTVAVAADTDVRIYETPNADPLGRRLEHRRVVRAMRYSPDGRTLLTQSDGGEARLWDVAGGEPRGQPLSRRGPIHAAAFNPDGKTVVTGGDDGQVLLWDTAANQALEVSLEIKASLLAVGYRPDGKTLITAAADGTAQLWDAATSRPLGKPIPIPEKLASLQLSASGKTLLALGQDGTVRLWDVAELPDDFARVATWIEVTTGLTTDSEGTIKPLDHDAWQQRRDLSSRLGGSPVAR